MIYRALAIDVGVWNFSYAIVSKHKEKEAPVSPYVIERWANESMPALAGYPIANGRISGNTISMTLLTDICFAALGDIFPAEWVRHNIDAVWIESQPRFRGKAGKIAELSYIIYSYFRAMIEPSRLCCWRFPDLQMVGAGTKFDGGDFFGLSGSALLPTPCKTATYAQRKAYGVKLVTQLLDDPRTPFLNNDMRDIFRCARKKDDYSDSLLLVAVVFRDLGL